MFLSQGNLQFFLISFQPKGQFSILTELLTSPRSDQLIRSPDDQYWKDLKKELLRRPLPFSAPILCVVRGLQTNDTFNKQSLDGYVYETLGGNHRRLAIQDILRDKTLSDAEKDRFKYVHVQLYAGKNLAHSPFNNVTLCLSLLNVLEHDRTRGRMLHMTSQTNAQTGRRRLFLIVGLTIQMAI